MCNLDEIECFTKKNCKKNTHKKNTHTKNKTKRV